MSRSDPESYRVIEQPSEGSRLKPFVSSQKLGVVSSQLLTVCTSNDRRTIPFGTIRKLIDLGTGSDLLRSEADWDER